MTAKNTWRQLLKRHQGQFLSWLVRSGYKSQVFDRIATELADFIVLRFEQASCEDKDAPVQFWDLIPSVLSCCNDLRTFEVPLAAEAYAYVHFLERYRRTWETLEYLTRTGILPLGSRGVRVLDIGAGPAHCSYAIQDYYAALTQWATTARVTELALPLPALSCVEQSASMTTFFHHFSEFAARTGPFASIANDFAGLDLASKRDFYRRQNEITKYWNEEMEEHEEFYDPVTAYAEAERLFRFRLLILSNFLTLHEHVRNFESELIALFSDLLAGGVAIVLGSTHDSYQKIYTELAMLARRAGLRESRWNTDSAGDSLPSDPTADRTKRAQNYVFGHLVKMVGSQRLQQGKDWEFFCCCPDAARSQKSTFALRVFRSGRWPYGA